MLEHGVDAPHAVLCAFAVVPGHDRLEYVAPVGWAFLVMRIGLRHFGVAAGFLQPQFQLRFVGIEADCCRCIRTTDTLLADLQPVLARQFLGADQAQGRAFLAGAAVQ
ncbi:hypothetical protein AN466_19785 [Pseudomonas aeruginosa]|nr:hypothetical protein BH77_08035 [Pseudomonas aeruginosa C2773C]OFC13897.1 hypothetical protein AN466_19785 [Pseudomonas aeruginosa]